MPREQRTLLYVGIKGCVVALDRASGEEMWRVELRTAEFVTVFWDGTGLFAANSGEVWRLNPATGEPMWHNEMKRLGRGLVSLASSAAVSTGNDADMAEEKRRRDETNAAAAAAVG